MMRITRRTSFLVVALGLTWSTMVTTPLASAQIAGIDVSNYQGTINWSSVKKAGKVFAVAKATEGTTYTDPQFATNWKNMKAAGIIPGAYHYGHPGTDAVAQAKFFVNTVKAAYGGLSGGLQLVLDIETTDGESPATVSAWIKTFCTEIQTLTGKPAIIYTGFYFWRDDAGNSTNNYNCPLWIASYTTSPSIPAAWSYYTFWQYTDTGSVSGISGNVDLDKFNGTTTGLNNLRFP